MAVIEEPADSSPKSAALSPRYGVKLTAVFGVVLAIAGTVASPEGAPIQGLATRVWVPLPDWLVISASAALSIASLILLAMVWPRQRERKQGEDDFERYHEPHRVPPLLAAFLFLLALMPVVLLGGAIFWLALSDASVLSRLMSEGVRSPAIPLIPEPPSAPASPVTTGLIGTLALLAGVGSLAFILWLFFGDRLHRPWGEFARPLRPLAAAVEDSLEDLRREIDARTAILKIYGNFERVVADANLPRRPSQTPVEFMRSALGKLPLPAAAVASLTDLFLLARFSQHPIRGDDRDRAWQSLIEIRAALDKERQGPDAAPL